MRNYLFTPNRSLFPLILIAGISIYYLAGIFPISVFETDSIAIANACQHILNTGQFGENILGHSFHMQSGTYFLIVVLSRLFHISTFLTYSILSAIFGIVYFVLIVFFVNKLTGVKYPIIILVLFLFPEISALAYYPNSTSIAAATWMGGFLILCKSDRYYLRILIAGILLSIAAWFRMDILFVYPSVLLLFIILKRGIKLSVIYAVCLVLIVIPLTLVLMYVSNAQVSGFLGYSEYYGKLWGISNGLGLLDASLIRTHLSFFSAVIVALIGFGFYSLIKLKKWDILIFIISGIGFFYLFGTGHFITPKHLAVFIPFWLIIALVGVNQIQTITNFKKPVFYFIGFLFLTQYLVGYNIEFSNLPYANKPYAIINPEPKIVKLLDTGKVRRKIENIEIRLGAGTMVPSQDEYMLSSGLLFSPVSWTIMKSKTLETTKALRNYIDTCKTKDLKIIVTDGSSQVVINALFNKYYFWSGDTTNWSKKLKFYNSSGENIFLIRGMGFEKNNENSFTDLFEQLSEKRFLVTFLWDWQVYMMEEYHLYSKKIAYGVYEINQ